MQPVTLPCEAADSELACLSPVHWEDQKPYQESPFASYPWSNQPPEGRSLCPSLPPGSPDTRERDSSASLVRGRPERMCAWSLCVLGGSK